jgi:hypothetical protein
MQTEERQSTPAKRPALRITAVLIATAVAFVGCGSSTSTSGTTPGSTPQRQSSDEGEGPQNSEESGRVTAGIAAAKEGGQPLTDSSSCVAWRIATNKQRMTYARKIEGRLAIPSHYDVGSDATAYAFGYIGGECSRAPNQEQTTIGDIVGPKK